MSIKKFLIALIVSLAMLAGAMYLLRGANYPLNQHVGNSSFIVGIIFFFPGLVTITGAGRVFTGFDYAARKMFTGRKKADKAFKSYYDFKMYKEGKRLREEKEFNGSTMLILGVIYIVLGLVL